MQAFVPETFYKIKGDYYLHAVTNSHIISYSNSYHWWSKLWISLEEVNYTWMTHFLVTPSFSLQYFITILMDYEDVNYRIHLYSCGASALLASTSSIGIVMLHMCNKPLYYGYLWIEYREVPKLRRFLICKQLCVWVRVCLNAYIVEMVPFRWCLLGKSHYIDILIGAIEWCQELYLYYELLIMCIYFITGCDYFTTLPVWCSIRYAWRWVSLLKELSL